MLIKKFKNFKKTLIPHIFLIFVTLWLRLVYLGYSDYQGDEIKAMYRPAEGQHLREFLFDQRKGPLQFLITGAMKSVSNNYYDNLALRLPFALAGVFAVLFFYKVVKMHFGRKIALYSTFFMSVGGFFVAFARIVQYQSFTILFFLMALYYFSRALYEENWKFRGWYFGSFWWGLSALAHYDAFFVIPFVIYIFALWFKKYNNIPTREKLMHVFFAGTITLGLITLFYLPYVLQLSDSQLDYWFGRLSDKTGKISSSIYLFKIYNPLNLFYVYLGFTGLALFKIKRNWMVWLWATFPFLFMEVITDVPGTHIYNYLLPVSILMAFGLSVLEKLSKTAFGYKIGEKLSYILVSILFLGMFLISHTLFVDHNPEYPWQPKKFFLWTIPMPQQQYHLSIFGFPYYRHWKEIETYIRENSQNDVYGTNERKSIPRFYLDGLKKEGDTANHYIFVYKPQSFTESIYQNKPFDWVRNKKNPPTVIFENNGKTVVKIYEMPPGKLSD